MCHTVEEKTMIDSEIIPIMIMVVSVITIIAVGSITSFTTISEFDALNICYEKGFELLEDRSGQFVYCSKITKFDPTGSGDSETYNRYHAVFYYNGTDSIMMGDSYETFSGTLRSDAMIHGQGAGA